MDWDAITLLVLDVDGVLTDGSIVLSESGSLIKAFHAHDGYAIKLWKRVGGEAAIISGRESAVVKRRAAELGIELLQQGCEDKLAAYEHLLGKLGANDAAVCCVGDDMPDLPPMRRCAFPVAVANAVPCVKQVAQYVTRLAGGAGAVAETIELILRKRSKVQSPKSRQSSLELWTLNLGLNGGWPIALAVGDANA
ncbi:MAG: HAD hydrolase family protein [Phycisphaerae bacterium]|nr:HAD hydrolase family protein [Phycisphaerae bacterium]